MLSIGDKTPTPPQ